MTLVAVFLLLCTCSGGGGSSGGGTSRGGGGSNPPEDDNLPSGELVEVHLARTLHSASQGASGFLASLSQDRPGDSVILALKPRLFRLNPQTRDLYQRVAGFGASAQIVPSYPYFKGPSAATDYETWAATWEAFLVSVVDEAVSLNQNWQWDIWNEPNWPTFWIGTKSQYFETWKRAHRIIRSRIPNATIVGPSIAYYDESYLREFLLYAQSNNVLPHVLTWHELTAESPGAIESRVAAMRGFMAENSIPVSRIQLNEITAQSHQFRPGSIVWFFAAIERAGVEAACKSCWLDGFEHNCINDSLNGLLNSPALEPRSSYWAYRAYAEITGEIVELVPSESLDGVVGIDPSSPAVRVMIGNHDTERRSMNLRLDGFTEAFGIGTIGAVTVRASLIPNSEREPLPALTPLMNEVRTISSDRLTLHFPDLDPWSAVSLEIAP